LRGCVIAGWFGVEEVFCECCRSKEMLCWSEKAYDEKEVLYLPTFRSRVFDVSQWCAK
jgi:hypothetical protein